MTHGPNLFISSTCYDLRQLRADLEEFARSLGLNPILSELSSFPIDPHLGTIDNCLSVVDKDADLFLLIIGSRYGNLGAGKRSVTNLEYIRARAKGIPIYVFVQKPILNILPVWKKNPEADFGSVADSPLLFEFVETIRKSDNLWMFPFELAQEIVATLRSQLGYLFLEALNTRRRLRSSPLPESISDLQGNALRILIDRPSLWEYALFAAVLSDGIATVRPLKFERDNKLRYGTSEHLEGPAIFGWLQQRTGSISSLTKDLDNLFLAVFPDAVGPPRNSGDPEKIVYTARKVAEIYRALIMWSIDCNKASVDPVARRCVDLFADYTSGIIAEIENLPGYIEAELDRIRSLLAQAQEDGSKVSIRSVIPFKYSMPGMEDYLAEVEQLAKVYAKK